MLQFYDCKLSSQRLVNKITLAGSYEKDGIMPIKTGET
jgi:hypothetical protein